MRTLADVAPTDEQLAILSINRPGVELIKGAAGSGKTTTALLRLRSLIGVFVNQRRRADSRDTIRVLVLTYNRTLRGYVRHLARHQVAETELIDLEVSTFAKWARQALGNPRLVDGEQSRAFLIAACQALPLDWRFLFEEAEYVMGRFLPDDLDVYLGARRDGRGTSPRMERPMRERLLSEVIAPYNDWKTRASLLDWNDLAVSLTHNKVGNLLDIVILDETQDFSANQVRAILNQLAPVHALTFVMDSAQRIYPRGFTWSEVGITIPGGRIRRLTHNYRNTIEIARFAQPLLHGLQIDDDGTIPDFSSCVLHGPLPRVLVGRYSQQAANALDWIALNVNLANESVAFLHPLGGGWFAHIRGILLRRGIPVVDISRQEDWPTGPENVALSTLHSSKGLEFDHVVILGLNSEVLPHGEEEGDDKLGMLRRLLAMGIGRARKSATLGYKKEEGSDLVQILDRNTYEEVIL